MTVPSLGTNRRGLLVALAVTLALVAACAPSVIKEDRLAGGWIVTQSIPSSDGIGVSLYTFVDVARAGAGGRTRVLTVRYREAAFPVRSRRVEGGEVIEICIPGADVEGIEWFESEIPGGRVHLCVDEGCPK